jgi:hypothetical protein
MIDFVYNKLVFLTLACGSGNEQLSQYEKQTVLATVLDRSKTGFFFFYILKQHKNLKSSEIKMLDINTNGE